MDSTSEAMGSLVAPRSALTMHSNVPKLGDQLVDSHGLLGTRGSLVGPVRDENLPKDGPARQHVDTFLLGLRGLIGLIEFLADFPTRRPLHRGSGQSRTE